MILGVIPARGGSKGLPRKNVLPLCGKPVIAYTLEAALASQRLNDVVVSTDDPEIARVARRWKVRVLHRPSHLATDAAPLIETVDHAVQEMEREGKPIEIVVWMQANVPVRWPGQVDSVIDKLLSSRADSVHTVIPAKFPLRKAARLIRDREYPYFGRWPTGGHNRQDYVQAFFGDGAVTAVRRACLAVPFHKRTNCYYYRGRRRVAVIEPSPEYGIEIDTRFDFRMAEAFLAGQKPKRK